MNPITTAFKNSSKRENNSFLQPLTCDEHDPKPARRKIYQNISLVIFQVITISKRCKKNKSMQLILNRSPNEHTFRIARRNVANLTLMTLKASIKFSQSNNVVTAMSTRIALMSTSISLRTIYLMNQTQNHDNKTEEVFNTPHILENLSCRSLYLFE